MLLEWFKRLFKVTDDQRLAQLVQRTMADVAADPLTDEQKTVIGQFEGEEGEYMRQMYAITNPPHIFIAMYQDAAETSGIERAGIGPKEARDIRAFFEAWVEALGGTSGRLTELQPPARLRAVHETLIDAIDRFHHWFDVTSASMLSQSERAAAESRVAQIQMEEAYQAANAELQELPELEGGTSLRIS